MSNNFYLQFKREDLILRDYLAADRTILANERTLMSFVRTAIALVAAGASLLHFFDSLETRILGFLCFALAAAAMVWGLKRYLHYRRHMALLHLTDWHEQIQWVKPGEGI